MIEGEGLLLIIALGMAFIVLATSGLKLHPFLALLLGVFCCLPLLPHLDATHFTG